MQGGNRSAHPATALFLKDSHACLIRSCGAEPISGATAGKKASKIDKFQA
jgi:hypothetical protein